MTAGSSAIVVDRGFVGRDHHDQAGVEGTGVLNAYRPFVREKIQPWPMEFGDEAAIFSSQDDVGGYPFRFS